MSFESLVASITAIPNFQEIGILLVFVFSAIPFVPAIPEGIMIALIEIETGDIAVLQSNLLVISTVGAVLSHLILFYAIKYHAHKVLKYVGISKKSEMSQEHFFHKYGVIALLFTPLLFFLPLTDILTAIMAHYRMSLMRFLPFMIAGEIIRGIAITYGVIEFL